MPTRWTEFVKEWAGKNNMTYGCALSKPEMKEEYYNKYPKKFRGKGVLSDIRKGLNKVGRKTQRVLKQTNKAIKLGANQAVGFVGSTARKVGEVVAETAQDVGEYGKAVIYGRMDYPPKVRNILKKYGEEVIVSYKIKRTPVSKLLTSALSAVSLGVFGKRFGRSEYDELFHLFLEMTTASGKVISVEKNEVINMEVSPLRRDKEEVKAITTNVPQGLTISEMMRKTEEYMGKKEFFGYSARDNNCQDFIIAILKSNNIGDDTDIAFVKQNTKELFKNLPFLRKFANTITDLGARVNVITTGAGMDSEGNYIVQSVVFSKDKWTTPMAKKWLKENGYISPKVDRKMNTLRFRQKDPAEAEAEGYTEYRTKELSDSGIQLILSYKKKVLSNSIKKMPRFTKGSPEAKEWGRMMREKRMKGGSICEDPEECAKMCPTCKRTMDIEDEMEGGRINIGKPFKKLGRTIKKGFEKEIINPSAKALTPLANQTAEYITKKKGGLATDLIRYGIPALAGTTAGLLGAPLGPAQGMIASAIGTKLGAMGATELRKATGTGITKGRFAKGSPEAKEWGRMMKEMRMK